MGSGIGGAEYQVFLSFRGTDTRQGFADYLYHTMVDAGVRVFRDNEEIPTGEKIIKILRAIDRSTVCIPVLSRGYASSKWCLRELAEIVEKKKKIMPVFYDVTPDDVKLYTPLYLDDLNAHEVEENEKEKWKKALQQVAKIKGTRIENFGHGEICKLLVKEVLDNLKVKNRVVSSHLVGIDEKVNTMLKYLDVQAPGVRYVGIHGLGGCGKSTLAKTLFNQLSNRFKACSFLGNIRESSRNGLEHLQQKLIHDLLPKESRPISDTNDGINILKCGCCHKEVLIVLDDVNRREQIECLAGSSSWFHSKSRIIVTTRDIRVLMAEQEQLDEGSGKKTKELWTLELEEMNYEEALQLFSRHAFKMDYPPDGFLDLSKKVISIIGRLPLSLEIIGSSLYGKRKEVWEVNQGMLLGISQGNIQETLMISYRALDFRTQQIFLDIACLPPNLNVKNATHMWRCCGFRPEIGMKELTSTSLVKVMDDDILWMHDHVRELGQEIICMESFMDPGKRSRLWNQEEALDVVNRKEGTSLTQTLHLSGDVLEENYTLTPHHFEKLQILRFLQMNGIDMLGDFKDQFTRLSWLSWQSCPLDFKATNLCMEKLAVLDLSHSDITESWNGWSNIEVGDNLAVLDLSSCKLSETPDLSQYQNLERLILNSCDKLEEIHGSIGELKSLKHLNLKDCNSLRGLPKEIGSLKALEQLFLSKSIEASLDDFNPLPKSIGNLKSLVILELVSIGIKELPCSIGRMRKLEHLSLDDCSVLQKLPDTFGYLKELKWLQMRNCGVKTLPWSIQMMKKLEEFHAPDSRLKEIPDEIGSLSSLRVMDLSDTEVSLLPLTIRQLSSLEDLLLDRCDKLGELPGLPTSLISLRFQSRKLKRFPDLSNLGNLISLVIGRDLGYDTVEAYYQLNESPWYREERLEWVDDQSRLERSIILWISDITTLPAQLLASVAELQFLSLCCPDLLQIPELPSSLLDLHLTSLREDTQLPCLSNLNNLSYLILYKCSIREDGFRSLGVEKLEQLTTLELIVISSKMEGLQLPGSLQFLYLCHCNLVEKMPNLSHLQSLQSLNIEECEALTELQGLGGLESLQELVIGDCTSLESLSMHLPVSLKILEVRSCGCLRKFPNLSRLKNLEVLAIIRCEALVVIPGLGRLASLQELVMETCPSLKYLWHWRRLPLLKNLREILISSCDGLTEISGLEKLVSLQKLVIVDCNSLKELRTCFPESLKKLRVFMCHNLEKLPDVLYLMDLQHLDVTDCKKLAKIPNLEEID